MFFFGSPRDNANIYWENSLRERGPTLPDCHYTEMEIGDLENLFVYIYMTRLQALEDGVSSEVNEYILKAYDEVFEYLAYASEEFVRAVDERRHVFLPDYSPEVVGKYRRLAGLPPIS